MEKEIIKIDEIEKNVSNLTKFDITKEELEKQVEETKNITLENLEDKVQLERVKRAKLDLRNIEIEIEKTGKSYRDIFTKVNKNIMAKQKELLAITNPEVLRLKTIEDEAKELEERKEREKLLPYRKEKLSEVGNTTEDSILLEMNDKQFSEYLLEKTQEKVEKDRLAKEEKEREEQKQKEIEEAREQAKKDAEEKARLEIERIKQEAIEKEKRDLQAKKDAEEKLAKEKDYQKFLNDNNYNENDYKIINENGEAKLYKYVASYKLNK